MGQRINNPPVFYVLAHVQFNPVDAIDKYIPDIQDAFRKAGFDERTEPEIVNAWSLEQNMLRTHSRTRWQFFDRKRSEGIVLSSDFVVIQTTHYETFETFRPLVEKALSIINSILELSTVKYLGLRYLNAVCRPTLAELSEVVKPGVLGLQECSQEILQNKFEILSKNNYGQLVSNIVSQRVAESGALISQDLFPTQLIFQEKFRSFQGQLCTIDMDQQASDLNRDFSIDLIANYFENMNKEIHSIFENIVDTSKL